VNARAKLESKGIDLLVANDVSQQGIGFDADDNEVLLLRPLGRHAPAAEDGEIGGGRRDSLARPGLRAGAATRKTPA